MIGDRTLAAIVARVRSQPLCMASSTPLTNGTASSVLNVRASSSASSMTTAGGVSGVAQQLVERQPQDQAIEHGHALEPPVLRGFFDQRIDRGAARATVPRDKSRGASSRTRSGSSTSAWSPIRQNESATRAR